MNRFSLSLILVFAVICNFAGYSQYGPEENDTLPENVLLEKQWSLGAQLNTNGWGLKLRRGHNVTALRQFMWEVEFSTAWHVAPGGQRPIFSFHRRKLWSAR